MNPWWLFDAVDLLGVFVGSFTGALVARRHGFDIMGYWSLALVSGLGGGIIRDLCLQIGPPVALTNPGYLPIVVIATIAGAVYGNRVDQSSRPIVYMDSVALISFAVSGSLRTLDAGLGVWPVTLLGVITAVGGGVLRDVLTGGSPMIFRRAELYAFAALGTTVAILVTDQLDAPRSVMVICGFVVGLGLRFGSLHRGWMSWQPR